MLHLPRDRASSSLLEGKESAYRRQRENRIDAELSFTGELGWSLHCREQESAYRPTTRDPNDAELGSADELGWSLHCQGEESAYRRRRVLRLIPSSTAALGLSLRD